MRTIITGNVDSEMNKINQVLTSCASGCVLVGTCRIGELPDQVAQHRPQVIIVDFSSEADVESALQAIEESRETLTTGVIAVGPSSDAKLILKTLNHGVDKYVDRAALESELPLALRQVAAKPQRQETRGRVIAVVGCGGGSGATTLVANIGTAYAAKNRKCYLIDLDLETGALAPMLGARGTNSIAEFCENLSRMDHALLDKCLTQSSPNLWVLPAPLDYSKIRKVTARGIRKAINMMRSTAQYVVVDVPCTYRPEQAQVLFAADVIVVVLRAEYTLVRQASRILGYLADLGIPEERVRLVVNRRQSRTGLRDGDIESTLSMPIHRQIPEDQKHMSAAANRGIPLVADRPRNRTSRRLQDLAHSVNGAVDTNMTLEESK